MRHRKHVFKIGRTGAHRKAMLANMVSSLVMEETIRTTLTKAKEARRLAEKMITRGKKGDLHSRRIAISILRNKEAVSKIFDELAPKYQEREGGYTRIIKLGQRRGDAANMCVLQFVEQELKKKQKVSTPIVEEIAEDATENTEEVTEEITEDAKADA